MSRFNQVPVPDPLFHAGRSCSTSRTPFMIRLFSRLALACALVLPGAASAQDGIGFRYAFGHQRYAGDISSAIEDGVDAEFSLLVPLWGFRVGAGANWVSLGTAGEDTSWSQLRFHGLVGRAFQVNDWLRPYAEARGVFRRLRPEDDRFFGGEERVLRDFAPTATGFEGVLGAEILMSPRWSVDLSAGWSSFTLDRDLSSEGFGPLDAGSAWRLHAGVAWYPWNGRGVDEGTGTAEGGRRTVDGEPEETDAWGQPTNFGLAAAETFMGNFLPWTFNETVPGRAALKISQISPRSWWRNLEEGWEWDDNAFGVNHFAHPFQGSVYFNSARGNGYGYWSSLAFATAGSFHWECCGETHLMSINDWVNTSVGGAAVGEVLYRTSSMILDNEATGLERVLRELGAFAIAPTRGFARMTGGNAFRVYDNPDDARDWRPEQLRFTVSSGLRESSSNKSARFGAIDENLEGHGYLDIELVSGTRGTLERRRPFDYFRAAVQVNFIRGRGLGELRIDGSLWHRPLSSGERSSSKLVAMQNFEYTDNTAFEFGGQTVGLQYFQERLVGERSRLEWHAGLNWMLLGGVDSELAFLGPVEGIRERFREYDFGIGPGAEVGLNFDWRGRPLFEGAFKTQYQHTVNGSNLEGFGSSHILYITRLRGMLPVQLAGFSAGVDYERFHRRSNFEAQEIGVVNHWASQWQFYLRWSP
jgi:hypothetical protein